MPGLRETLREYLSLPPGDIGRSTSYWHALRTRLKNILDSPDMRCVNCGLPLVENSHPDAGRPDHIGYIGAQIGCITCAEKRANGRAEMWIELHAWFHEAAQAGRTIQPLDAKNKMLDLERARREKFQESC